MTTRPKLPPIPVSTAHVIALAREIAGTDDPNAIIETLARIAIQAAHGTSAGYSRLPPARDVTLTITGEVGL